MSEKELWLSVNRALIAKSIGELSYEQVLKPQALDKERYKLVLSSGVEYRFLAWRSVWDHLCVRPESIRRFDNGNETADLESSRFFIDSKNELEMSDITLGNFLEEMHNTLFADMYLLRRSHGLTVQTLARWDGNRLQSILNGHPKILLNKGRLGWGANDLAKFSPEVEAKFQLHWIAVSKKIANVGLAPDLSEDDLCAESLSETEVQALKNKARQLGCSEHLIVPVHPWQWDRVIRTQWAGEIANGNIVSLGEAGDTYQPQISIRTLSNLTRPEKSDIKLPVSVLNTSAVRGIPGRYIKSAPEVAANVSAICRKDSLLQKAKTEVLEDFAGVAIEHSAFRNVEGAPYRYKETLGAIWRKSVGSKIAPNEIAALTASLSHCDSTGRSLIGEYIRLSGLSKSEWLKKYFETVTVPLYHLQLEYGLGIVAHGQNIVLRMTDYVPSGVFLKDFQGDLRIAQDFAQDEKHAPAIRSLDSLPPNYLIHDLITGHFVSVLRFISETMHASDDFPETEFYAILANCVRDYLRTRTPISNASLDLLKENFERVLLNKVRFKIGYADSASRPLPLLGTDLINPLFSKPQGELSHE